MIIPPAITGRARSLVISTPALGGTRKTFIIPSVRKSLLNIAVATTIVPTSGGLDNDPLDNITLQ